MRTHRAIFWVIRAAAIASRKWDRDQRPRDDSSDLQWPEARSMRQINEVRDGTLVALRKQVGELTL
jgi:hypothetical protein